MNRFWGRNDQSTTVKFSRDDEQILALNYENLCDGDYLNRLFVSEASSTPTDDTENQNNTQQSQQENSLYTSDISEDLMVFGKSPELGRNFYHKRLHHELLNKNQDSVTNIVNRQVIVFEHIGRLMLDRCILPPTIATKLNPLLASVQQLMSNSSTNLSFSHLGQDMLFNALRLMQGKDSQAIKQSSVESVVMLMFQVLGSDGNLNGEGASSPTDSAVTTAQWTTELIDNLRAVFHKGIARLFAIPAVAMSDPSTSGMQAVRTSIRLALTCFYGLLGLALHTRDQTEVSLSLAHLMTVMVCAEEWQDAFSRHMKARIAAVSIAIITNVKEVPQLQQQQQAVASPKLIAEKAEKASVSQVNTTTKAPPIKSKQQQQSELNSRMSGPAKAVMGGSKEKASAVDNATSKLKTLSMEEAVPEERRDGQLHTVPVLSTSTALTLTLIPPPINTALANEPAVNNKQTGKPAVVVKATAAEKELLQKNKLQAARGGNIKPSGADNGKLFSGEIEIVQGMIAAAASQIITVNHVSVTYNTSGPSNNNCLSPTSDMIHAKSARTSGLKQVVQNGESDRLRKELKDFKDSLTAMMRIPKPILRLIYDCCHEISTAETEASCVAAAVAAGNHTLNKSKNAAISLSNLQSSSLLSTSSSKQGDSLARDGGASSYVWSSGQNSYGELGVGDVLLRKSFSRVNALNDKNIVSIGAGNEHSLFVSRDGKLYTAGYNDNGQCGMGSLQQVRNPSLVTALEGEEIVQVHVYNGCEHTLAVTKDGKLFAFGYNYRGQLGLGTTSSEATPRPVRALLSRKVVLAACSYHHSVLLCSDGAVFSCGRNDSGQLGHGDTADKKTPQAVQGCPRGVNSISCGQFHTIASTTAGVAYACGKNDYGQLGMEAVSSVKSLTKINNIPSEMESIAQVCCGYYHTMILSNTGIVAGFGRNDYGQLGLSHAQPKVYQSTVIGSLRDKGVTMVSAGCYHSVVVTANGMLYVFGRNNHGQLATGDLEERHSPHPVDNFVGLHILSVAAGFYHTIVLMSTDSAALIDDISSPRGVIKAKLGGVGVNTKDTTAETAGSNLVRDVLMREAIQLTGISSPSRRQKPFELHMDLISRVSSRELLLFLVNHTENLIDATHSTDFGPPLKVSATTQVAFTIPAPPTSRSIQSILCSLTTLLEVARRMYEDEGKHCLSRDEAQQLLHRVVKIITGFVKSRRALLLGVIQNSSQCASIAESLSDDFRASMQPARPVVALSSGSLSSAIKDTYSRFHANDAAATENIPANSAADDASVVRGVLLLRHSLLSLYFTPLPEEEERQSKHQETVSDIAQCLTRAHEVFFATSQDVSQLFTSMRDNILLPVLAISSLMSISNSASGSGKVTRHPSRITSAAEIALANKVAVVHTALNMKLFAMFCSIYRTCDEVVKLFSRSKQNGLTVFRHTLSLYGHFSKVSLEKRVTHTALTGSQSTDIRRIISALEHTIPNFIKCAMPVIYAASLAVNTTFQSGVQTDSRAFVADRALFAYGTELIHEVLSDAESVIDYLLLQQPLTEDVLCQLRYGTVMPSILPSILIYGTSFVRFGCTMLDIIPKLHVLIKKLQLVGKAEHVCMAAKMALSAERKSSSNNGVPSLTSELSNTALSASPSTVSVKAGDGPLLLLTDGPPVSKLLTDEPYLIRKDSTSWWFRLLKLCITLSTKMSTSLIHCNARPGDLIDQGSLTKCESTSAVDTVSGEKPVAVTLNTSGVIHHNVWKYVHQTQEQLKMYSHTDPVNAADLTTLLQRDIEEGHTTPEVTALCAQYRNKEKSTDLMYKMLSQSGASLFSNNLLSYIEECFVEAVVSVSGSNSAQMGGYFKLISRVTKHIHSKRSTLLTYSGDLSWVEVLMILCNTVKLFARMVIDGDKKMTHAAPMPLPFITAAGCSNARRAFRRVVMTIICLSRWRSAVRLRLKSMVPDVIDFVFRATDLVTDGFSSVSVATLAKNMQCLLGDIAAPDADFCRYSRGMNEVGAILENVRSIAMKCDVLSILCASLRDRIEPSAQTSTKSNPSIVVCSLQTHRLMKSADQQMITYAAQTVAQIGESGTYHQQELQLLAQCIKLIQVFDLGASSDGNQFNGKPTIPLPTLRDILMSMNEKQKQLAKLNAEHLSPNSTSSNLDKQQAKRSPGINLRERNNCFRRATNCVVSYLQSLAFSESQYTADCRPYICIQLIETFTQLLSYHQACRVDTLRKEAEEEETLRLNIESSSKEGSSSGSSLLNGLSHALNKSNKDSNNKKRYQDIVTKPTEFSRHNEGFVVQGDKLLNNYKGVDFAIATWILVAKKNTSKYSFIAGKVSHNDVWPLIILRLDGKLEITYGLNNDFEKLVTEATIPSFAWTHIAVVVESKKIKVFINGVLDCHVISKGHNRAVLFPLVVGSCPLSMRTRIPVVREGFDGMLSQLKYFSRPLNPANVKSIFDQGPPETIDLSERLSYQLLASLKCLIHSQINCEYFSVYLQRSADLLHRLFVTTETSRRLRFAALDILSEILRLDAASDLQLSSKLLPSINFNMSQVSISTCSFLHDAHSFHERVILYFMRLLGASWAPHFFSHAVDEQSSAADMQLAAIMGITTVSENMREELLSQGETATQLAHFLNFAPNLLTCKDPVSLSAPFSAANAASAGLSSGTMVEKLISSEITRGEICHHVLKLLCALANSGRSVWTEAIVSVLQQTLSTSATYISLQEEMECVQKVDLIGAITLLSGGTAGPYLGANVRNFFGDNEAVVLSINKTTSSATLLTWNALRSMRQITKVRLSDLKVEEYAIRLPLQELNLSLLLPSVFQLLNALSDYIPLLLTDMLSTFRPDHILQSKSLLRCMRPVELFIYSQLLQSIADLKSPALTAEIAKSRSSFYSVVQQAAVATLRLEDYEDELITEVPSMNHIWNRCANYMLSLPTKLSVQSIYTTSNDDKIVYDFIAKHLGVNIDSIVDTPYEKLLTQGRLAELVQYISVDNDASTTVGNMDELVYSTCDLVSKVVTAPPQGRFNPSASDRKYLVSDWASNGGMFMQWPSLQINHGSINEQDYINILRFIYLLRRNIVTNSRIFLSDSSRFNTDSLREVSMSSNMLLWQSSLLMHSRSYLLEVDSLGVFYHLMQKRDVTWSSITEYLSTYNHREVTESITFTLRYSVSVLQEAVSSSETNILLTSDLFKRSLQTMYYWLQYSEKYPHCEEVCVIVLKIMLAKLSHIANEDIQVQLVAVCVAVVRKLCVRMYSGYKPTQDLMDVLKGHNYTLLRTMAQSQITQHKSHNLNTVAPIAYQLTQLVTGIELVQRFGSIVEFDALQSSAQEAVTGTSSSGSSAMSKSTIKQYNALLTAKIQLTETAVPRITCTTSSSVGIDVAQCANSAIALLRAIQELDENSPPDALNAYQWQNVTVEVVLASTPSVSNSADGLHFETIYCGTSLKFTHNDLSPDCNYALRCRAFYGTIPLNWSATVDFRTEKGVLFTFDRMKAGADICLSGDMMTAAYQGDDSWSTLLGTRSFSSGITAWEIRITKSATQYIFVGVATSAADLNTFLGGCGCGYGFIGEQALYHNREKVKIYGEAFATGDVIGVTLDLTHGTLSFSKNHKSLGVAFDKIYGDLFPAVAFYNADQQVEILPSSFRTTCPSEPIPVSPSRLSVDEIGLLNELVFALYYRHPLSHRLLALVTEHCNQWSTSVFVRCRAVSGRDVFLAKESPQLRKFNLTVGDRVRTPYGVAEVAGAAYNKVWFRLSPTGDVWFFSNQQITDGRSKKLFNRCSYDAADHAVPRTKSSENLMSAVYDVASIQELVDPAKWSEEMDSLLMGFLATQAETLPVSVTGGDITGKQSMWAVTAAQVHDNFRLLQQPLSRLMMTNNDLSYRWGIAGPKRKAVLARLGLLRMLNQMLDMYLPFLIADTTSNPFAADISPTKDTFNPMVLSLRHTVASSVSDVKKPSALDGADKFPFIHMSWDPPPVHSDVVHVGPIHAIRRRVFSHLKLAHFWEVTLKSATRPSKTDDDYDYPEDLPHVRINRLKSFRAREASELMGIPGEDLLLSSMFCQLWRELRQHSSTKLRISYTHPMDDGQSRTFKIKFDGEGVDDYGGPYREIFQQVCEELQRPDPSVTGGTGSLSDGKRPSSWVAGEAMQQTATGTSSSNAARPYASEPDKATAARCFLPLLIPTANWTADVDCKERYRYTFNPSSVSPLKQDLYHFLGQMIGIAIRSRITLDLMFPSLIWKCVVGERLCDADLASIDATAYDFVSRLGTLSGQIAASALTDDVSATEAPKAVATELLADVMWTVTLTDGQVLELVEGGASLPVEIKDISRYLTLYVETRLSESKGAIDMFRCGLISIIPESVLSLLTWEEVQNIVCGARVIDIQRLSENTEYDDDISADDEHIVAFWEVLTEFSEEEKSTFLKFVWARPTLPPKGVEFSQKMRVLSAVGDDAHMKPDQYLPKAHTCFFSINLPKYSTKKLMAEKLRYAITNCTEMDADFKTTDVDVAGWGAAGGDWQGVSGNGDYN